MKLELTVRDEDGQLLAYIDREKIPVIMLNRDDLDINDKSSMDSSTGLLKRNGVWTRQS
jgi:ABC-2 type transport system ATP-binding protein